MLKKPVLIATGLLLLVIGMITFPLPLPVGLPLMLVGLSLLLKTSAKVKKSFIRLTNTNDHTRKAWGIMRRKRKHLRSKSSR